MKLKNMKYSKYKNFNYIFLSVTFIIILSIFNIDHLSIINNPYNRHVINRQSEPSIDLKDLSAQSIVAAKLTHAVTLDHAYDVAIFGNSRVVMLSAHHIGAIRSRTFFNFAVGGTAFQQSVRALEYLVDHGKPPKVVVISYDNAELQFVGVPYWPQPIFEVFRLFKDVAMLLGEDYATFHQRVKDAVKLAEYFAEYGWHHVELAWNFERMVNRIDHFAALWRGADRGLSTNLQDGSRTQQLPTQEITFEKFHPQTSAPRAENRYILIGLRRLARLAEAHGIRIIIYESPLAPPLARKYRQRPTAAAVETRRWIATGCADSSLECHPAPSFELDHDRYWPDCCHAPADQLGAFVSRIIATRPRG